MSTHTIGEATPETPTAGAAGRTAAPTVQLDEVDESLSHVEGRILVLYGDADAPAIEAFDRTRRTGDASIQEWLVEEFEPEAHDQAAGDDAAATAAVGYHGRLVAQGLSLGEGDSLGVSVARFLGGDLDETGFVVEHGGRGEAVATEYRVLVVPPELAADERSVTSTIPDDTDESRVRVDSGVKPLAVLVGETIYPTYILAGPVEQMSDVESDSESRPRGPNPSFEELFDAHR